MVLSSTARRDGTAPTTAAFSDSGTTPESVGPGNRHDPGETITWRAEDCQRQSPGSPNRSASQHSAVTASMAQRRFLMRSEGQIRRVPRLPLAIRVSTSSSTSGRCPGAWRQMADQRGGSPDSACDPVATRQVCQLGCVGSDSAASSTLPQGFQGQGVTNAAPPPRKPGTIHLLGSSKGIIEVATASRVHAREDFRKNSRRSAARIIVFRLTARQEVTSRAAVQCLGVNVNIPGISDIPFPTAYPAIRTADPHFPNFESAMDTSGAAHASRPLPRRCIGTRSAASGGQPLVQVSATYGGPVS